MSYVGVVVLTLMKGDEGVQAEEESANQALFRQGRCWNFVFGVFFRVDARLPRTLRSDTDESAVTFCKSALKHKIGGRIIMDMRTNEKSCVVRKTV